MSQDHVLVAGSYFQEAEFTFYPERIPNPVDIGGKLTSSERLMYVQFTSRVYGESPSY